MSADELPQRPLPIWVKIVIVASMLPVADMPWLIAGNPEGDLAHTLLWLYPAWVLLAGFCAWKAWSRSPELTWILIFITILAHGAMWLLCYPLQ